MNKLREKFKTKVSIDTSGEAERFAQQCEQISDDFTIKFYDWTLGEEGIGHYTTAELLKIFKDKYYEIN